jgi:uncharacterized protein
MKALFLAAMLVAGGSACALAQPATVQFASASQASTAPTQKTFFIRLIPPRPTFDKDMTEAEQKIMEQHFLYWKSLFEKGVCLFGGPVLDPRGIYGVLAIQAPSEDEARGLAAGDPSVKAGVNRIEVAEMRIAFPPKIH